MMANSIYGKTLSKGTITGLNTAGFTNSYHKMKRQKKILFQYTLYTAVSETLIPSYFSKGWTMNALHNENFTDQILISRTNAKT